MGPTKIIKKMPFIHCARGPKGCEKCKEFAKKEPGWALIELFPEGEWARPVTEIIIDGQQVFADYDILSRFDDIIEAKQYAQENDVDIVKY